MPSPSTCHLFFSLLYHCVPKHRHKFLYQYLITTVGKKWHFSKYHDIWLCMGLAVIVLSTAKLIQSKHSQWLWPSVLCAYSTKSLVEERRSETHIHHSHYVPIFKTHTGEGVAGIPNWSKRRSYRKRKRFSQFRPGINHTALVCLLIFNLSRECGVVLSSVISPCRAPLVGSRCLFYVQDRRLAEVKHKLLKWDRVSETSGARYPW